MLQKCGKAQLINKSAHSEAACTDPVHTLMHN